MDGDPLFSWVRYEGTEALVRPLEICLHLLPLAEHRNSRPKAQGPKQFQGMPVSERFILSFQYFFFLPFFHKR